jgi:crotonobetaine/carnitine-CoA ligase
MATPIRERTVAAVLARHVAAQPASLALLGEDGTRLTYAETQQRSFRIANGLRELGVQRQGLVLVMLGNHVDHALVWLGLNVGAIAAVPLNTALRGDILAAIAGNSGAEVIVADGAYCDRIADLAGAVPALRAIVVRGEPNAPLPQGLTVVPFDTLLTASPEPPDPPQVSDVSTVLYTSGTEGSSKGVMCVHGHTFAIAAGLQYAPAAGEVVLVVAPLFHAVGLFTGVYSALCAGATALIQGSFSASRFWQVARDSGAVQSVLVGAMADFLWRRAPQPDDAQHGLRDLTVVPAVPFLAEFASRFGVRAWSSYGQTETGITMLTGPDEARPYLCGQPRSCYQVRLVDDDDVDVPPGQVGEIVIRSSEPWTMMKGYHGQPEATVRAWRNLWLHTGDCAFQDEHGRYVFVDRKRDALRRRGENVSSLEVENCILRRADVDLAAIVAVASDHSEDDIKAYLVMSVGAQFDPVAMLYDLAERLPYFMVPRYYEVVESLPMTPSFKIRKSELRARGLTPQTWDCEAHGFTVTRTGVVNGGAHERALAGRRQVSGAAIRRPS